MNRDLPQSLAEALETRGLQAVLDPARRTGRAAVRALVAELSDLDWELLDRQRAVLRSGSPSIPGELQPPPLAPPSTRICAETTAAEALGWEALRAGRVALCTVAGGQASRLGFDGPKGAYPLGAVSGASLFQILAGQVRRLRERAKRTIPWIIQTGPSNHAATLDFFARHAHFGLGSTSLRFVCQGTLPALSPEGQLLLARPSVLFRSPDGHGGFYRALARHGVFADLRRRGIDTLFYCQVDNPLVRMGDPVFLGHHLQSQAQMSVKVVAKTDPAEKVGLVAIRDGRTDCVEYSDLSPELAAQREPDGQLRFRAGNIAIHAFALDFAARMADTDLPFHLARKRIRALGHRDQPELREGVKFETFVFDALSRADPVVVQLCEREEEFAPVKNRNGRDSVATSRAALDLRARRWLAALRPDLRPGSGLMEIRPGLALDSADLGSRAQSLRLVARGRLLTRT